MLASGLHNTANTLVGLVVGAAGAALAPVQDLINLTIKGLNLVLQAAGKQAIASVDFATSLGKTAKGFITSSWNAAAEEGGNAWEQFQTTVGKNTADTMAKLNGIMATFGNGASDSATGAGNAFAVMGKRGADAGAAAASGAKKASEAAKEAAKIEKERYETVKQTMTQTFQALESNIGQHKSSVKNLKSEYDALKKKLAEVGTEGAKELAKIEQQLAKQAEKVREAQSGGTTDVAKRVLDARKELKALQDEQAGSGGESAQDSEARKEKMRKLEAEIALGQAYAGNEAIQAATTESQKSEVQLIIDKTAKKVAEAEAERAEIQKTRDEKIASIEAEKLALSLQMEEKKAKIKEEHDAYLTLVKQRRQFDSQYFALFQEHIAKQILKTKEAINLMDQLASK